MNKETELKVLSLFDGISCARVAIERAGFKIERYYASEIDKYAIQIAQKNFPDTIQVGSVTDIKMNEDIDILIGGSPCQDLSIAGKRKGLCGARSGLFYEYVRIRGEVKPKYFILENVNSMPKEAKDTISKELGVDPIMINAALVSAQNRKRLFWVGKLVGDKYEQVDIELPEDKGILLKDILEEEVDEKYYIKPKNIKSQSERFIQWDSSDKGYNSQQDRAYTEIGKSPSIPSCGANCKMNVILNGAKTGLYCISSNQKHATISEDKSTPLVSAMGMGGGHIPMVYGCGARTGLYAVIVKNQGKEIAKETDKACTLRARDYKGFDNYGSNAVFEKNRIRKLTPIECERLQGLPDNYTEGVSNTQRYKGLGNAFNVDVVAHIIKSLSKEEVKQEKLI